MTPTDDQLELALAKALPDSIHIRAMSDIAVFLWEPYRYDRVTDCEWLHVCALVEARLTAKQFGEYIAALCTINGKIRDCICSSWQSRALALVAVGAITIEL